MDEKTEILLNLKQRRESLGISLEDLHAKTKIRAQILKQIDNCDLSGIDNVYAISFIKSIGSALKMDSDEINEIINKLGFKSTQSKKDYQANVYVQNVDFSKSVFKNEKKFSFNIKELFDVRILNYLIYFSLLVLLISVVYFTFFNDSVSTSDNIPNRAMDTLEIKANGNETSGNMTIPDSVVLEARGIDTAWLRLVIDGKQSEQIVMLPKMERQWIAKKYIQLSVGNGGAIEFKRNGKILEPFGAKGSVVRNVRITPTEIVVSSAPWSAPKDSTYMPKKPVPAKKKDKKKEKQAENQPKRLESSGVQEQFKPYKDKKR